MGLYLFFILAFVGGSMGFAALFGGFSGDPTATDGGGSPFENPPSEALVIILGILFYAFFIVAAVIWQQGLWLCIFNYNMSVWKLRGLKFKSTMRLLPFCQIMVTNVLLSILSLGFLIPWAKIRATRYMMENLSVIAPSPTLGEFTDEVTDEESAIGDAAVDYFDFEVGW